MATPEGARTQSTSGRTTEGPPWGDTGNYRRMHHGRFFQEGQEDLLTNDAKHATHWVFTYAHLNLRPDYQIH